MELLRRIFVIGFGQAVIRESVGPVLANIGWGPLVTGILSTVGVVWQAWAEDKTTLDIFVYGLATFASAVFLSWLGVQFWRGMRGVPMTLAIRERLSLGEIANRWAAEMFNHPGAITKNAILEELLASVWNGDFEDGNGNSQITLVQPPENARQEKDYGKWNRRKLLAAMLPSIRTAVPPEINLPKRADLIPAPDSTPKNWKDLRKIIPWEEIKKLHLYQYSDTDIGAYVENLTISKNCFQRWAHKRNRKLPRFWFGLD